MTFNYNTLKRASRDGCRLGNWNGKAVFAASAEDLENKGSGAYYILYDDENKIVGRSAANGGWKSYGEVTEQGSVNEYSNARNYKTPAEAVAAARKASYSTSGMKYSSKPIPQDVVTVSYATESCYTPGYDRAERPVGDVKTELDVEATLQRAREMTIENLLEGFLPGLSYDTVAKG